MHFLHLIFLLWTALVSADETSDSTETTTSSSVSPTLVWVTATNSLGVLQTFQSTYIQTFPSYSVSTAVPSGSINLGSISGTVGAIRQYTHTTINGAEGAQNLNIILKVFPFVSALLGLLLI